MTHSDKRGVGLDRIESRMGFPWRLAAIGLSLTALVAAFPDRGWGLAGADGAIRPNVVIIFVDNFGNGDLGCFGSTRHRTPHVDRLAAEGTKFTSFYVGSGVCTPSRASLMTGCYPRRVNLHVSDTNGAVVCNRSRPGD